jgi:hypothetical protein
MSVKEEWMTAKEVAEFAGMPYPHLWTYRKRGILPMPDMYIGSTPLWKKEAIESLTFPEFKTRVKK